MLERLGWNTLPYFRKAVFFAEDMEKIIYIDKPYPTNYTKSVGIKNEGENYENFNERKICTAHHD